MVRHMRILHLCDSLNPAGLGGYESYLYYLSKHLALRGHECIVVTQAAHRRAKPTEQMDHLVVRNLRGNLLEARKWEYYAYPENERDHIVDELFSRDDIERNVEMLIPELGNVLKEFHPDIIHAHSTYVIFNRVLHRLRISHRTPPTVLTVHGLPKHLVLPSGEQTTDYGQLAQFAPFDIVLGVSKHVTRALTRWLGSQCRVELSYIGVDLQVFRRLRGMGKSWDIAFMGRLELEKGVDLIPSMLQLLSKEKQHNVSMVITGEGSFRNTLLGELERLNLDSTVEYLGVIPLEMVPEIINRSKVFIYPSRREPFGLSIVEAMACQTAVVSTNAFGPSEIITHGRDGIVVAPDSATELADAVHSILGNPADRNKMGAEARRTVESRFDISRHTAQLLEIYEDLVRRYT